MSFKLANDRGVFGVDRIKKSKTINRELLFNWFDETDSNTYFETTSSECETSKSYAFPCCNCPTGIVCPEIIDTGCDNTELVCQLCYCYKNTKEGIDNHGFSKNHDSEYYIVRNKDPDTNSYGKIIDVVNLKSYTSSESEIQPNNIEIHFKDQNTNSDVNEYSEICLDSNSSFDCSYKPKVHRMFKNNKIVVLPYTKDKNYYFEDSE